MRAPRAILAALLALLALGFSPASAQDAPSTTSVRGPTWVWEIPLDDIDPAPEVAEVPEVFQADYGHGIVIEGDAEYVEGMTELLDSLALLPSGQELLESLGETGFSTTITPLGDRSGPAARPVDPAAATFVVGADGEESPGPGSDALVFMDPDSTIARTTAEIVLGHELLHALHYHHGERLNERQTEGPNAGTKFEELRTIGTDGYDDEEISENQLREEWNELYPDRPVAPERNGHRATDFGPSRTAHEHRGCCEEGREAQPTLPIAVAPTLPRGVEPRQPREFLPVELPEIKPIELPEIKPLEPLKKKSASAEGAADILRRNLGAGQ